MSAARAGPPMKLLSARKGRGLPETPTAPFACDQVLRVVGASLRRSRAVAARVVGRLRAVLLRDVWSIIRSDLGSMPEFERFTARIQASCPNSGSRRLIAGMRPSERLIIKQNA